MPRLLFPAKLLLEFGRIAVVLCLKKLLELCSPPPTLPRNVEVCFIGLQLLAKLFEAEEAEAAAETF